MILITDSGSTKCDWILLDEKGEVILKTRTPGLNPAVTPEEELKNRIVANEALQVVFSKVLQVDFYGAGCGTAQPSALLSKVLASLFMNAEITVSEDTMAAVYATTIEPGIVCILGTGSNSCYFDGNTIHSPIASLGYILMDEASGNYFGKRLLRDYFYKKMPEQLAKSFEAKFNLNADEIKLNLYKKPNANMYLASFAEFIFHEEKNRPYGIVEINDYFYALLSEGINSFIENHILCFKEAQHVPIHFVGSIAHFSQDIIRDCFKQHHLVLGNIIRRPIDGLIKYYRQHKLN
ncbi:hypothetical protein SCB49_11669 [unidentified eubacterium SCB49]|nr:hypothetical protein SCB49_11669 [unidentified eubacterium SCB49]